MPIQELDKKSEGQHPIDVLVERITKSVLSGNEQPDIEMKKQLNLSDNYEKSEFIKDIQSIANSPILEEKLYVIGADEGNKCFIAVSNIDEFDEDKIRKLLDGYLSPQVTFKKYNIPINKENSAIGDYIVVVIPLRQSPPHIIIKNLTYKDERGKDVHTLREGDCWVKSGGNEGSTGRRLALREDYDRMYSNFVEANTEKRLEARLQFIREENKPKVSASDVNTLIHIKEDIIYEDIDSFVKTIETWILNGKNNRIDFLIKKISILIKREWEKTRHKKDIKLEEIEELTYNLKYNIIIPSLTKLFHMGSIFLQYDTNIDMFEKICKALYEINLLSRDFPEYGVSRIPNRKYPNEHLSWTLLAFETAVIIEALGALCVNFKNYRFLNKMITNSVCLDYDDNRYRMQEKVVIFMPFDSGFEEPDYRTQGFAEYVNRRALNELGIGRYVYNTDIFLDFVCQYGCILEMNSYGLLKFVSNEFKWSYYAYFYRYKQDRIYPFIYEAIKRKEDGEFYNNLIFKQLKVIKNFNFEKLLVRYLRYLPWYRSTQNFGPYGWWSDKWPNGIQKFIDDNIAKDSELKNFKLGEENS